MDKFCDHTFALFDHEFADHASHMCMIKDHARCQGFFSRIKKHAEGKTVIDFGAGTGLLGIYASMQGAKEVWFCENQTSLHGTIEELCKLNNVTNYKIIADVNEAPSNYFDLVISAQVAEHLRDDEVIEYYSEEGRVLKKEGLAYHELPHKYIPYESHTRLWLIHLFPYFCKPLLYGIFISIQKRKNLFLKGSYYAYFYSKKFLILRTPNFHKKMLLKYIGHYEDITVKRLKKKMDFSSYDHDSPTRLRKIIQKLFNIPILGRIFISIFKNFFILQTLARRNN